METKMSMFNSALKSGLIIGAASIVLFILMYVADIKPVGIMMPIMVMLASLAITIVLLVILFKKYRTQVGGFISFGDAFLYCFIAMLVSILVSTIFTLLFVQFVEPDYYKNIMEANKTWFENYLAGKVSDEQLTQTMEEMDKKAATMGSFSTTLKNLLIGTIFGVIIALIVAAIMKKKAEIFDNNTGGVI